MFSKLQKIRRDVDNHREDNKRVHQLGESIISDPKANDTSFVKSVLAGVDNNWSDLDDILSRR